MSTTNHHRLIILGSGPAGLTAAIYAARANLKPVLVHGIQPGGQLTITTEVENYPGFPEGIQGPEVMELFKKQAERFETQFIEGEVVSCDLSKRPFQLQMGDSANLSCDALIIATGASAKWLGLDSEEKFMNRGVSACATCDGFFFRNQDVAVVGGGDTALEEALYLSNLCRSVTVIHRRGELRASKIMQARALKNEKITFLWHTAVEEVLGDDSGMTGLRLRNLQSGSSKEQEFTGLFVAIGHQPNTGIFQEQLSLNENGYIIVQAGSTFTSVEGVFASGDAQDFVYR
ncbi:MAG: thioredoxin-disulfide reductase, partial [Deltaproteobacteria bacterium]